MRADGAYDNPPGRKSAGITPQRYREIRALFESAVGIAQDKQADWLQEACKGDDDLYRKVEELLLAARLADDLFPGQVALKISTPEKKGLKLDSERAISAGTSSHILTHYYRDVPMKAIQQEV